MLWFKFVGRVYDVVMWLMSGVFNTLKKVVAKHCPQVIMRVAGGWVRDKVCWVC